jgi:hypothetical protein
MNRSSLVYAAYAALVLTTTVAVFIGCDDSSSNTPVNNNPFNPPAPTTTSSDGGTTPGTDGGGDTACSKPAGCFCGTPTTQEQWLNRCTNAAALPVNLTVKAATQTDIP